MSRSMKTSSPRPSDSVAKGFDNSLVLTVAKEPRSVAPQAKRIDSTPSPR
jgi:hypothetical protein